MVRRPTGAKGSNQYRTRARTDDHPDRETAASSFTAEDVALAFDPERVKWANVGVTVGADVERLKSVGLGPNRFKSWARHEFTIDDCVAWRTHGFTAVIPTVAWRDAGFTADQAAAWRDCRFISSVAREWADLGYEPVEARAWNAFASATPSGGSGMRGQCKIAEQWRQHSTVEEAYEWRALGFTADEAARHAQNGRSPSNYALIE